MNVLNYQGLQNDIRNISKKKFDLSSIEEILQELNNGNDNRVILW